MFRRIKLKDMIDFRHAIVTALDATFTQPAGKTDSVIVQKNHQTVIDCYCGYQLAAWSRFGAVFRILAPLQLKRWPPKCLLRAQVLEIATVNGSKGLGAVENRAKEQTRNRSENRCCNYKAPLIKFEYFLTGASYRN